MSEMSEKTTILNLMETYNELTKKYQKAREWDNNTDTPLEEKHMYADKLASLINTMTVVSNKIKSEGYVMSDNEYFEGFKQPEEFKKLGGKL